MKLAELEKGASFRTRLTHRVGVVLDQKEVEVQVTFEDGKLKWLHPDVEVDPIES